MFCKTWQLAVLNCVLELQESTSHLGAAVRGCRVVFVRLLSLLPQTASLCTGSDAEKKPTEQSLRHSGCSTLVGACGSLFDMQGSELAAILHICTLWNTRGIVVRGDVLLSVYVWSFNVWPGDCAGYATAAIVQNTVPASNRRL